jgi:hypothetical protein
MSAQGKSTRRWLMKCASDVVALGSIPCCVTVREPIATAIGAAAGSNTGACVEERRENVPTNDHRLCSLAGRDRQAPLASQRRLSTASWSSKILARRQEHQPKTIDRVRRGRWTDQEISQSRFFEALPCYGGAGSAARDGDLLRLHGGVAATGRWTELTVQPGSVSKTVRRQENIPAELEMLRDRLVGRRTCGS